MQINSFVEFFLCIQLCGTFCAVYSEINDFFTAEHFRNFHICDKFTVVIQNIRFFRANTDNKILFSVQRRNLLTVKRNIGFIEPNLAVFKRYRNKIHRRRAQKAAHKHVVGVVIDIFGVINLLNNAFIKNNNPIAHCQRLGLVVGYINESCL